MRSDHHNRLVLYAGRPQPCPYLGGRTSLLHYLDPQVALTPRLLDRLLTLGFRRSGRYLYRPACSTCGRCLSMRIAASKFKPNRSQRRTLSRNSDLRVKPCRGAVTAEQFELYERYLKTRHTGGGMDEPALDSCESFLTSPGCKTLFFEFRLEKRLVAVAVTDVQPTSLSAVYTFYEPGLSTRGLGTYAVCHQLAVAKQRGLAHLYIGYWVAESEKMDYKKTFRPAELLVDGAWRKFGRGDPLPMFP
jgi:arginine-tRNA-protein transferase